jgi:SM-20-related protein
MANLMTQTFSLDGTLDPDALAKRFALEGRLHIPAFLTQASAQSLYDHLRRRMDWRLIINQGETIFEVDRATYAAMGDQAKRDLDNAVYASARTGFQYRYEVIRLPDDEAARRQDDSLLAEFAGFMSSPPLLDFLRQVTGQSGIDFSDAQATAYGPGHFLTTHDDGVPGKQRKAAYVFNLSAAWRPEWGGLLMFSGRDGHVEQAYVPTFNALNLFAVPQPHSVSYVAPYVPYRRYAVTGWLRGR